MRIVAVLQPLDEPAPDQPSQREEGVRTTGEGQDGWLRRAFEDSATVLSLLLADDSIHQTENSVNSERGAMYPSRTAPPRWPRSLCCCQESAQFSGRSV
jgi:hypothetical protein